jgi:hypothetical protein
MRDLSRIYTGCLFTFVWRTEFKALELVLSILAKACQPKAMNTGRLAGIFVQTDLSA